MTVCEMVCNQDLCSETAKWSGVIYLHTTQCRFLPGESRVYLT